MNFTDSKVNFSTFTLDTFKPAFISSDPFEMLEDPFEDIFIDIKIKDAPAEQAPVQDAK